MFPIIPYLLLWLISYQTVELYNVVHVQGKVLHAETGEPLRLQDRLNAENGLLFKSPESKVVVYRISSGRYLIQKPAQQQGELAYVKQSMSDMKTGRPFMPRDVNDRIRDFSSVFAAPQFVFLGDTTRFLLSADKYAMSGSRFFIYAYLSEGKTVQKKLTHKGDTLFFIKDQVFPKETLVNPEAGELYYYNAAARSTQKLASFIPVFVSSDELKKEMVNMYAILKQEGITGKQLSEQLYNHIIAIYGYTDGGNFQQWVTKHMAMD